LEIFSYLTSKAALLAHSYEMEFLKSAHLRLF